VPSCGAHLADGALDLAHMLAEPIALRVARPSARTRSGPVEIRSAGPRSEASPHADIAADKPARLLINVGSPVMAGPSQTLQAGRFNGVSGRFERPKTSR
jgi:hypothetical protein